MKKIRLRISDCYRNEILEPIFLKMWKIMLNTQYEPTLLKCVSHITHIPLKIEYYEIILPTFQIALGVYYQSSYHIAKRPLYKKLNVFFDRFCYDFISLFGVNLLFLEID